MNRLLAPLAACFRGGVALRSRAYDRGWLRRRRLGRPVISVGNLTLGGTGKTPLVARIAEVLLARGWTPSVLTRGYGRQNDSELITIGPGADCAPDPRLAGDEPALLASAIAGAPIIVSANRFRAGRIAEERFRVDAHILDDGFQHVALERDLDIVLIDVTEELSDCAVLPAGRLREPPSALQRANIVVLTRTELADPAPIEAQVRAINPRAYIFRCSTRLVGFVDVFDGRKRRADDFQGKATQAFCGVGNPKAFFSDLRRWGMDLVAEDSFRDHHRYSEEDLEAIFARLEKSGAVALVTTEKDALNLPKMRKLKMDVPFVACVIRPEIKDALMFEKAILDIVGGGGARL